MPEDLPFEGSHYFPVDHRYPKASAAPQARALAAPTRAYRISSCWSFGPLELCAVYRDGAIDYEVKLLGQRLSSGHLDHNQASVSVGADLGLAKAGVLLIAEFNNKELVAQGEVCVRNWLGQWQCSEFTEVILRW